MDRPSLSRDLVHVVQGAMEGLAAEKSQVSSSAREAGRRMEIPELSVRRIMHGMLHLHLYKIHALYHLLLAVTGARQNFAIWVQAQMECNPQWLLNAMWTDEAHFSLYGAVNKQNGRMWVTSNPRE